MQLRSPLRVVPIALIVILASAFAGVTLAHSAAPAERPPPRSAMSSPISAGTTGGVEAPPAGYAHTLASEFAASGAPADSFLPPNPSYVPGYQNGVIVHPAYSEGPEPVGVSDYGVLNTTGTAKSITIDTTSYMGTLTLDKDSEFSLPGTGYPEFMTIQMNAVLNDTTVNGGPGYQFWTQNVLIYNAYDHTGLILGNLWNFSAYPQGPLSTSDLLSGNGTVVPSVGYYYDFGSPVLHLPPPFTIQFYLNATTSTHLGVEYSEVVYAYNIVNATTHAKIAGQTYDNVVFNNKGTGSIPQAKFHVDGKNLTDTRYIPFDAELIVGGNTGGSTASFNDFNGTMTLQHLDTAGTQYVNEPSTWNVGSETGETVVGLASYFTANDVVHIGPGPSFSAPFWNSSIAAAPGAAVISGSVSPSNAFAFVTNTGQYNASVATWAPISTSGQFTWNLTGGTYSTRFLASEFDPNSTTAITIASGASAPPLSVTMTVNHTLGVYTPLYAWNNAQLAAISSSGAGTLVSPYLLDANEAGALSPEFGDVNDYFYPEFTGIQLYDTSDYVEIANAAPFLVDYQGSQLRLADLFGLPSTNYLGVELFGTRNVSVVGGTLQGWFGSYQSQYVDDTAYSELVLWNSTSTLVTGVTFEDQGYGITLYGGTGNTITGNYFVNDLVSIEAGYGTPFIGYGDEGAGPIGIVIYEGGDLIFNNEFNTLYTAVEYNENFFDGLYAAYTDNFLNNWNLSAPMPASTMFVYNGITVSGSVNGSATVCGNIWWNRAPTTPVPYDNFGYIVNGGDYCAGGPALFPVLIAETGLPAGTAWDVEVVALPPESLPYGGIAALTASSTVAELPAQVLFEAVFGLVTGYTNAPTYTVFYVTDQGVIEIDPTGPASDVAVRYTSAPAQSGTLVFTQTGLPAGTAWSVTVGTAPWSSTTGGVANPVTPGTYSYTVGTVVGYAPTPSGGMATVSAGAVTTVSIAFAPTTGWIAGTVVPSSASVWVDGTAVSTTGGAFNVSVPGGTHSVRAAASGFATYYNNVTVVGGTTTHLAVVEATLTPTSFPATDLYAILGVVVLLAVAIVVAAVLVRNRKGRQPPAQTWSPSSTPSPPPPNPPTSGY
jgi:thermopsin